MIVLEVGCKHRYINLSHADRFYIINSPRSGPNEPAHYYLACTLNGRERKIRSCGPGLPLAQRALPNLIKELNKERSMIVLEAGYQHQYINLSRADRFFIFDSNPNILDPAHYYVSCTLGGLTRRIKSCGPDRALAEKTLSDLVNELNKE